MDHGEVPEHPRFRFLDEEDYKQNAWLAIEGSRPDAC